MGILLTFKKKEPTAGTVNSNFYSRIVYNYNEIVKSRQVSPYSQPLGHAEKRLPFYFFLLTTALRRFLARLAQGFLFLLQLPFSPGGTPRLLSNKTPGFYSHSQPLIQGGESFPPLLSFLGVFLVLVLPFLLGGL